MLPVPRALKCRIRRCTLEVPDIFLKRHDNEGIMKNEDAPAPQIPAEERFFGRAGEIAAFVETLQQTRTLGLQGWLVGGPPGVGKTRLAAELARIAENAGFLSLWGSWREDSDLPEYWVLRRVLRKVLRELHLMEQGIGLDSALSELSSLMPEIRDSLPELSSPLADAGTQGRLRLFDAVYRLLSYASSHQPLLVIVDNIHLAGTASLELLMGLFEELSDCSIAVIALYRNLPVCLKDPFMSFLADARSQARVRERILGDLEPRDAAGLVESILKRKPPAVLVEGIIRQTNCNPLFVGEAARFFRDRAGEASDRMGEGEIPVAVDAAVRQRCGQLSQECLEVLQKAAAIGERFSEDDLTLITEDLTPYARARAMEEGISHGFLFRGERTGLYGFSHAIVNAALCAQIPAAGQRALYERLASEMERVYASDLNPRALQLARYWGEVPGEKAAEKARGYVRMAAESAMEVGAWEEAIGLFGRLTESAMEIASTEEQADAYFGMGRACFLSGNRTAAVRNFRIAFDYYHAHGRLDKMTAIAVQPDYLNPGDPGFFDFYGDVLKALPPDSVMTGMVLLFNAVAQFNSIGDYEGAEKTLSRSYQIGVRYGDALLQARSLTTLAFIDGRFCRYAEALRKLDRADALLRTIFDIVTETHVLCFRSHMLTNDGRPEEALPCMDRWIESALRSREGFMIAQAYYKRSRYEMAAGAWDPARKLIDDGLAAFPADSFLLFSRVSLEYMTGDFAAGDAFRQRILAAQRKTPAGPYIVHIHTAASAIIRARHSGDVREVASFLPMLQAISAHPEAHPFIRLRAHLLSAFIAILTSDPGLARAEYDALRALPPIYLIRPYHTQRILGLAAHCFGDHLKAVTHLTEALTIARRYKDRPMEAWLLAERGEVMLPGDGSGPPDTEAVSHLVEALDSARALGIRPLEARTSELLERMGETRASGRPVHLHLSKREKEVLGLLAQGLSNEAIARKLGISPYTAANHVHNLLEKTGAANRTEAVSLARRLGGLE